MHEEAAAQKLEAGQRRALDEASKSEAGELPPLRRAATEGSVLPQNKKPLKGEAELRDFWLVVCRERILTL